MKKNLLKKTATLILFGAMILALSSCRGLNKPSNEKESISISTAKEPIPISQAFSQEGIWFEGHVEKDKNIGKIFYFNGKGSVTVYQLDNLHFSDLKDKDNKQILTIAKEQDKFFFENSKSKILKDIDSHMADINSFDLPVVGLQGGMIEKESYLQILNDIKKELNNQLIYKENKTMFKLKVFTDKTGNNIIKESILIDKIPLYRNGGVDTLINYKISELEDKNLRDFYFSKERYAYVKEKINIKDYASLIYEINEDTIELLPDLNVKQVYNMNFRGFRNFIASFVTLVDLNHPGFKFDTIDTEGVEVE